MNGAHSKCKEREGGVWGRDGQGGSVAFVEREAEEAGVEEVGRGGDEGGIEGGVEADADVAGLDGEAHAHGFEERFLEGPELEEVLRLSFGGEGVEVCQLVRCEDVGSYVGAGEVGVDAFEIDADGIVAGDGDGGQVAGVGDVELPTGDARESGLAVGFVAEDDFVRWDGDVAAEEEAEARRGRRRSGPGRSRMRNARRVRAQKKRGESGGLEALEWVAARGNFQT